MARKGVPRKPYTAEQAAHHRKRCQEAGAETREWNRQMRILGQMAEAREQFMHLGRELDEALGVHRRS